MARFAYRMQTILNLRYNQEDQAKTAFGEAAAALAEQEDRLKHLKNRKSIYEQEGQELRKAPLLDVQGISENTYAVEQMDRLIAEQEGVVAEYETALERARLRLTQAIQDRRMQERLRERAYEEYLEEERQAEYKESDQRTSFVYSTTQRD